MSKGFASNYRIVLLSLAIFACFGAVGTRLVWLHAINRDEFLGNIVRTRRQLIVDKARRGDIYAAAPVNSTASRGALLATSCEVWQLGVDPQALRKEDEKQWGKLADLIGMSESQLRTIFTTKYRVARTPATPAAPAAASPAGSRAGLVFNFSPPASVAARPAEPAAVATDLEPEPGEKAPTITLTTATAEDEDDDAETDENGRKKIRWAKLAEEISEATNDEVKKLGIKGVYATPSYRRVYPNNQLGAHIVGFVDRAQRPIAGIESFADFYLRGHDGWREGERDGKAKELPQFNTREVDRADGYSVVLSLDSNVQNIVERELTALAEKYLPEKATIVVSDARTGFILGLANYPSYNPNEYNKVPADQLNRLKNIAVADVYEPGSVFKIVAAAGALELGLVTPDTRFDCSLTKIEYRGKVRGLPGEDHRFDHPLSVAEIVAHSSNRGAAQLAMQMGEQRFYDYARAFGFGRVTGFPGGREEPGIMWNPKRWDDLTITRMPMGQSVAVTVLQMHQAMGVIASGGVMLEPQIVRSVRDSNGVPIYRFDRNELRRVVSERTARTMAQLLTGCVMADGTAPLAAIPGYEVAGKTGTTQKYMPDGPMMANGKRKLLPSKKHHVASFVGFFPASQPRVVISVIVDDADAHSPLGVAYGGKVAAPAFKRIGEQLIPILDIKAGSSAASVNPTSFVAMQGARP
jgi:cell division protein FtsI (penicillin-binding protein 3)